jgi:hypothetical protein
MKIVEQKVYSFAELDEKAQRRAIEDYRNFESEEWDPNRGGCGLLYDWADAMEKDFGLEVDFEDVPLMRGKRSQPAVGYSFYTQGSGANFSGKVDAVKWILATRNGRKFPRILRHAREGNVSAAITIDRNSHYTHEYTMSAVTELYIEWPDDTTDAYDKLVAEERAFGEALTEWARGEAKKLHRMLEEDYEGVTDEEHIREYLAQDSEERYDANGWGV